MKRTVRRALMLAVSRPLVAHEAAGFRAADAISHVPHRIPAAG